MKHHLPVIPILGIPVVRATEAEAMVEIGRLAAEAAPALLVYVNAHTSGAFGAGHGVAASFAGGRGRGDE